MASSDATFAKKMMLYGEQLNGHASRLCQVHMCPQAEQFLSKAGDHKTLKL
jgi:hypothetical protein